MIFEPEVCLFEVSSNESNLVNQQFNNVTSIYQNDQVEEEKDDDSDNDAEEDKQQQDDNGIESEKIPYGIKIRFKEEIFTMVKQKSKNSKTYILYKRKRSILNDDEEDDYEDQDSHKKNAKKIRKPVEKKRDRKRNKHQLFGLRL